MSLFVRRLKIRNYKSIGNCVIELGPFTLLIGRNGAGKSNALDALRFVVDGLKSSLDHAIRSRGGIDALRRKSTGHPHNFGISLDLEISGDSFATYTFEIAAQKNGGFAVKEEKLNIRRGDHSLVASFHVSEGVAKASPHQTLPPVLSDRLFLVNAAGLPEFRPVYDALLAMGFYNLNPEAMREVQSPDAGDLLNRDGSNIASVISRLEKGRNGLLDRLQDYLSTIVPGVSSVSRVQLGPRETLEFRQEVQGSKYPWTFYAASMSDGTLRTLGNLVAVMQFTDGSTPTRLIGIEEPETALHPAAAAVLMDALREAATRTQVVVTTHSPELLDQVTLGRDRLIVVVSELGKTSLAQLDPGSRKAITDHLTTPGDLLRMDQLAPDPADIQQQEQMELFSEVEG